MPLRREGDRGNKIQQKFPSVPFRTKSRDDDRTSGEFKAIDSSAAIIPDSNKKPQVESKFEELANTIPNATGQAYLIDPNEDLSIYLTKVPSVPSRDKKIGNDKARCRGLGVGFRVSGVEKQNQPVSGEARARCQKEFQSLITVSSMAESLNPTPDHQHPAQSAHDQRIENALKAHDLYFGWQRVVRQGILDVDDETENKVNRAISLVRRGTPIKVALKDAQVGIQISSFLLAISADDTEALASLSANVARGV